MARILLIDDDSSVRTALRLTLGRYGHEVAEATNGKEGLTLLQGRGFDLLITDIVMPEMEGLEVLRDVRAKHPAMKTIAISGGGWQSGLDYLRMAKLMGAATVLAKPFSTEALMAAVNALLPGDGAPGKAPGTP